MLGATAPTPDQLELELKWIDEHVDGKRYGIDVLIHLSVGEDAGRGTPSKNGVFDSLLAD